MKRRRRRQQRMLMLAGVVALLVIVLIVIISSCSKKNQTGGINAQAFSTGSELVLPLNAELNSGDYVSYGGYHFETKTKLAKMAKLITKNNENVTAANYDNAYGAAVLFTRDTGSGVESWCLYQQDPTHISNWYVFMGCHREVSMPDGILDMLLPLHLISDSYLRDNMGSRLALDTAYACGAKSAEATMQDQFKEFYANSGLYNMITLDTGFILTDKASGREVEFSFEETDESSWFTLKSTVPEEPEPSSRVQLSSTDAASEQEPVELSEADAITLSTILVNASYKTGTTASEYPYKVAMNGADYMLELTWKDDTWSASVQNGDQTARLTTKQACTVAAIFGSNYMMNLDKDESVWPSDAGTVTPMGTCMVTTNDVNVRSQPSTDGDVLMTSEHYLKEVLHDRFHMRGYTRADWGGVARIKNDHKLVTTDRDAIKMALNNGLDVKGLDYPYKFWRETVTDLKKAKFPKSALTKSSAACLPLSSSLDFSSIPTPTRTHGRT